VAEKGLKARGLWRSVTTAYVARTVELNGSAFGPPEKQNIGIPECWIKS
jgi:hypothetical protein